MEKAPLNVDMSENIIEKVPGQKYYFEEIMNEIKPAVLSLVKQLKSSIESGEYSTIISDDARGRIPTLILRKIFKDKSPNTDKLRTYFLSLGRGKFQFDSDLQNFLTKNIGHLGKSLIVTEYVNEGNMLDKLKKVFDKNNNYTNYDIATLFLKKHAVSYEHWREEQLTGHTLFFGQSVSSEPNITKAKVEGMVSLDKIGGVSRRVVNSVFADLNWMSEDGYPRYVVGAHPEKIRNIKMHPEPTRKEMESLKYDASVKLPYDPSENRVEKPGSEYDRKLTSKIRELHEERSLSYNQEDREWSEEKDKEIQDIINKGRQDVNTLANEILEEVWGKQ